MTPAPPLQKEYIITDMQIRRAMASMNRDCEMDADEWIEMDKLFRSRPHTTTPSEREQVLDDVISLLLASVHPQSNCAKVLRDIRKNKLLLTDLHTPTEAHR